MSDKLFYLEKETKEANNITPFEAYLFNPESHNNPEITFGNKEVYVKGSKGSTPYLIKNEKDKKQY